MIVFIIPTHFPADFQQNKLEVIVSYNLVKDTFIWGIAASKLPVINITDIKRK
jgi:hypothetical protein